MIRRTLAVAAAMAVVGAVPGAGATVNAMAPSSVPSASKARPASAAAGPFVLRGAKAMAYRVPDDVVRVSRVTHPDGTVATRFQQMVGRASVLNGQITVFRSADKSRRVVIGAHYPGLRAVNTLGLSKTDALAAAAQRHGERGQISTHLRIDPRNGRTFYSVDQIRPAHRWITWVDATTGRVKRSYNALTEDTGVGVGVKNDRKRIETVRRGDAWRLRTTDRNGPENIGDTIQLTRSARGYVRLGGKIMFDTDNVWNRKVPRYRDSDQRPGVDAHYYANVVDDFYTDTFGRNSLDNEGMPLVSVVHFATRVAPYCNAFWNGEQMTYGDGNGTTCKPLSGGLDVVGHELTHGVTEFTSNLIYEDESGALNESFSDIMANTIEFYAEREGRDPAAEPDWRIGEDVISIYDTPGFRNMADPQEFGDPDHYSERYLGEEDNGGVHSNSGISNLAYYLAVNGGKNPGCSGSASGHTHTRGCTITVDPMGLKAAAQTWYMGYTGLTEYANMCDARRATAALAGYQGHGSTVRQAWAAVGVLSGCEPGVPPPPPCFSDGDAELPFGSPHPYGNNANCVWRFDNGSPGFQFRFSLLDVEEDYDYVYVQNANGRVLNTYTGTYDAPVWSKCVQTREGIVRLTSDGSVTGKGFTVDAVRNC